MQHIVITGGNKGIGLALVKQYLAKGDQVSVICRQPSPELADLDVTLYSGAELSESQKIKGVAAKFAENSIDVLINNAGIFCNETLDNFNDETILKQFQVNSIAPLLLSQQLLGALKDGGKIAMITSRMGSIADNDSGNYYGYRMAKAALNAGSVSLANDLAPRKISVGIYHPGYVQTEMVGFGGDISPDEAARRLTGLISELSPANSGKFYHSNGSELPW
ncbi:NAD(P)-dependent dehydrogenase, short-chain alcohol dehydrogenase family [Arsukibacterium tuosuense]|uniref:NAD(P)-dependent dehydrogenase, short-chain alcohol dehydrogenase family n=1 Tax=Arsukibacterium tuosuense TaxID=1323745 RepID=A0A285IM99_9GAMM|nr:SDR family oxidoreductase [Arsukibacterium tuosuense]SNY49102.1 NAD(P)-dependent dehydrogenase, short-chain alcohol dehydrogenase family [Arsukibacterium tuosuense]